MFKYDRDLEIGVSRMTKMLETRRATQGSCWVPRGAGVNQLIDFQIGSLLKHCIGEILRHKTLELHLVEELSTKVNLFKKY